MLGRWFDGVWMLLCSVWQCLEGGLMVSGCFCVVFGNAWKVV